MFDHMGIQVKDVAATAAKLGAALAPVGLIETVRFEAPGLGLMVAFADADKPDHPYFWLSPAPDGTKHETHVAFVAPDRAAVDAAGAAAAEAGLEILHAARVWPEYHPSYYAVFFRDLDGNNVEAVSHRPE